MEKYNLIHAQITELHACVQMQKQVQNHSQSAVSNATYIDPMTLLQEIKNVETSGLIARKSRGNVIRLALNHITEIGKKMYTAVMIDLKNSTTYFFLVWEKKRIFYFQKVFQFNSRILCVF